MLIVIKWISGYVWCIIMSQDLERLLAKSSYLSLEYPQHLLHDVVMNIVGTLFPRVTTWPTILHDTLRTRLTVSASFDLLERGKHKQVELQRDFSNHSHAATLNSRKYVSRVFRYWDPWDSKALILPSITSFLSPSHPILPHPSHTPFLLSTHSCGLVWEMPKGTLRLPAYILPPIILRFFI